MPITTSFSEALMALVQQHTPFVMVTLVGIRGSAPQDVGARALVTESGLFAGTVGGGKVEAWAIQQAMQMILRKTPTLLTTQNLQRDIGMTCGGEVTFFFESTLPTSWSICVYGAGHVAQALVPLLCTLQCQVTCVDPRAEWLNKLPVATNLQTYCIADPEAAAAAAPPDSYICMMTKGHSSDVPILKSLLANREFPYVGLIGSAVKGRKVRSELIASGLQTDITEAIICPIGLPIGSNSPPEIAVSIAAQLLEHRDRD